MRLVNGGLRFRWAAKYLAGRVHRWVPEISSSDSDAWAGENGAGLVQFLNGRGRGRRSCSGTRNHGSLGTLWIILVEVNGK